MTVPELTLNNGVRIPQLGFGVFQIEPKDTQAAVSLALAAGYRHIDGAQGYRNEAEVWRAVQESGLAPDDVFLTSKLSNAHITYADARRALDESIEIYAPKKIDLFLIHWPLPTVRDFMDVWPALQESYDSGDLRAIGVASFQIHHLERLMSESGFTPAVNQIELHPYLTQDDLRTFDAEHGIVTEAFSPIGQGLVLDDPVVNSIAAAHARTPAQVVLRWHMQIGTVAFPKSTSPARIAENFDIFDFSLSAEEISAITALDRRQRTGADPDTFRYKF